MKRKILAGIVIFGVLAIIITLIFTFTSITTNADDICIKIQLNRNIKAKSSELTDNIEIIYPQALPVEPMFNNTQDFQQKMARESRAMLEPSRIKDLDPKKIIKTLGVKPGDTVADIGTGYGLDAFPLAQAVGSTGTVYAVEIGAHNLYYLLHMRREMAIKYGPTKGLYFDNIVFILSKNDDITLRPNSVKIALMQDVHFLFYIPGLPTFEVKNIDRNSLDQNELIEKIYTNYNGIMKSIYHVLKKDGELALIENKSGGCFITKEALIKLMNKFGFKLKKDHEGVIRNYYFLVFTKK